MRFTNWDVLLFPQASKTPIQEFKTACFVVQDPDFIPELHNDPSSPYERSLPTQLPTVAGFVPNLPNEEPFRISIHSWEVLVPISKAAKAVSRTNLYYEARVVIDGLCVAGLLFHCQGPWPQVIDMSTQFDKTGNRDSLRFPKFRPEILSQSWWSAGEVIGRIKVTISEGYLRAPGVLPFMPLKNIVTFSFQHAPLNILESSGIAWPNPGMWYNPSQLYYNTPSPMKNEYTEAELHAHSPRRHAGSVGKAGSVMSMESVHMLGSNSMSNSVNRPMMPFPPMPNFNYEPVEPGWAPQPMETDPFMGSGPRPLHDRFTTSEDHSMPDCSRSLTPASGQHRPFPVPGLTSQASSNLANDTVAPHAPYDGRLDELVHTLESSMEKQPRGVVPPHNTQTNSLMTTPLADTKTQGVAEMGAGPMWDTMDARMNQIMNTPTRLPSPMGPHGLDTQGNSTPLCKVRPNPMLSPRPESGSGVKSRKEGMASDVELPIHARRHASKTFAVMEDKENSTWATANTSVAISSEGKRKRRNNSSTVNESELVTASPTRKATRRAGSKTYSELSADTPGERQRVRTPLEGLDNV